MRKCRPHPDQTFLNGHRYAIEQAGIEKTRIQEQLDVLGSVYGKISNLIVYTETGSINLTEIAKYVRAKLTVLNATDNYIASNAQALVPSIYDNWPTVGDILMDAASFGDASFNPWAVMLKASDLAPTPDEEACPGG